MEIASLHPYDNKYGFTCTQKSVEFYSVACSATSTVDRPTEPRVAESSEEGKMDFLFHMSSASSRWHVHTLWPRMVCSSSWVQFWRVISKEISARLWRAWATKCALSAYNFYVFRRLSLHRICVRPSFSSFCIAIYYTRCCGPQCPQDKDTKLCLGSRL